MEKRGGALIRGEALNRDYTVSGYRVVRNRNKAVYTTTPVAGGWAGAVMSWAGAITSMKYSYLNFSTFKLLKNAKKVKCDGRTDRPTR